MSKESIRAFFPIFRNDERLVYLDNAATTQKPEAVIRRLEQFYCLENANIHRGNYPLSLKASEAYQRSKESVCQWIDAASSEEIAYTKGSTEAINLVARGIEGQIRPEDNVVITELEHSSNYFPWKELCRRTNAQLRIAEVEKSGALQCESVLRQVDEHTKVLAITGMSNVTGECPDLDRIIAKAHEKGALVIVDATQLIVHRKISVQKLDCDFLSFSSHKLYGPMGLGVLYGKRALLAQMEPLLYGGDMVMRGEKDRIVYKEGSGKFEGGTQNVEAALGFAAALDFLRGHDFEQLLEQERQLAAYAKEKLQALPFVRVFYSGPASPILLFEVCGMGAYDTGVFLGLRGIAVRCGSHCAYPLMKRMGVSSVCRASLAVYNTQEDVDRFVQALIDLNRSGV